MIDELALAAPLLHLADAGAFAAGDVAELEGNEVRHVRALRLGDGDPLRVTDGQGSLWAACLSAGGAAVRLLERLAPPPPLEAELWVPVGNKRATLWLVEKAAEFGLRRLQPVEYERSASVADAARSAGYRAKARRRALAAVKQSGGAWAPEIEPPAPLVELLAATPPSTPPSTPRIVLEPNAPPLAGVLADWAGRPPVVLLIGPEGGLTGSELAACRARGFRPASLGPTILRFETAAVAALAVAAQQALVAAAQQVPAAARQALTIGGRDSPVERSET